MAVYCAYGCECDHGMLADYCVGGESSQFKRHSEGYMCNRNFVQLNFMQKVFVKNIFNRDYSARSVPYGYSLNNIKLHSYLWHSHIAVLFISMGCAALQPRYIINIVVDTGYPRTICTISHSCSEDRHVLFEESL
jgi:hypothetical protein